MIDVPHDLLPSKKARLKYTILTFKLASLMREAGGIAECGMRIAELKELKEFFLQSAFRIPQSVRLLPQAVLTSSQ